MKPSLIWGSIPNPKIALRNSSKRTEREIAVKKINIALAISAGLAGWAVLSANPLSFGQNRGLVEETVAAQLRDPASASFRDMIEGSRATCGEVNGHNGFGGAAGFKPFVYIDGVVLFEPEQPGGFDVQQHTTYLADRATFTRAQRLCRE